MIRKVLRLNECLTSKVLRGSINVATDINLVSILWGMWILYWTDNKFISAVVMFNTIQPLKSSPYATYFPYGKLASMMIIFSVWKISEKLFKQANKSLLSANNCWGSLNKFLVHYRCMPLDVNLFKCVGLLSLEDGWW